jgi:hypothetical protein
MASCGSTANSTMSTRVRTGCGLQEQPICRPECCLVCKATCPGGPSRSSRGRIPSKEIWGPAFAIGDTARKGDMAKVAGHYATMCARCGSTVILLRPQCSLGYDNCCKSKATARWRHVDVDASCAPRPSSGVGSASRPSSGAVPLVRSTEPTLADSDCGMVGGISVIKRAHMAQVRNGRHMACAHARVCAQSLPPAEH